MNIARTQLPALLRNARRAGNPAGAAAVARAVAQPTVSGGAVAAVDTLEARFDRRWADLGGPELEREYRFDAVRKWRFDRCILPPVAVAIELDGGVYTKGRDVRPKGFIGDASKLNQAAAAGWLCFRVTPAHLDDGVTLPMILRTIREREGAKA